MKKQILVKDFSIWLDKLFREGRINNISQTQHWIRVFLKEKQE